MGQEEVGGLLFGDEASTNALPGVLAMEEDLVEQVRDGFGRANLFQMKGFYLAYPEIAQPMPAKPRGSRVARKVQTASGQFGGPELETVAVRFPLPWSHYVRLLAVRSSEGRKFYEEEALRGGWTKRQLDRQIDSQFYERTALSRNKAAMLGRRAAPDPVAPEEEIEDPYVLEFLGLKDEYSEKELEGALIEQLQAFLMELGGEFSFVGRQKRLRVGDQWFRIDLLLFHRRLRCLVIRKTRRRIEERGGK